MSNNLFKFTIEHLEYSKGPTTELKPLIFEATTREDLFMIVEKMKTKIDLSEADATTFAVGLKLFGEVLMKNSDMELFKQFKPHFANFMKDLKKS